MVLATTLTTPDGEAHLLDYFSLAPSTREIGEAAIVRIVEGIRGSVDFRVSIVPRFDGPHQLRGEATVVAGERRCLELAYRPAAALQMPGRLFPLDPDYVDESLDATVEQWRKWCADGNTLAELVRVEAALVATH